MIQGKSSKLSYFCRIVSRTPVPQNFRAKKVIGNRKITENRLAFGDFMVDDTGLELYAKRVMRVIWYSSLQFSTDLQLFYGNMCIPCNPTESCEGYFKG